MGQQISAVCSGESAPILEAQVSRHVWGSPGKCIHTVGAELSDAHTRHSTLRTRASLSKLAATNSTKQ